MSCFVAILSLSAIRQERNSVTASRAVIDVTPCLPCSPLSSCMRLISSRAFASDGKYFVCHRPVSDNLGGIRIFQSFDALWRVGLTTQFYARLPEKPPKRPFCRV